MVRKSWLVGDRNRKKRGMSEKEGERYPRNELHANTKLPSFFWNITNFL